MNPSYRHFCALLWVTMGCTEQRLDLGRNDAVDDDAMDAAAQSEAGGQLRVRALALGLVHTCALTDERMSCIGGNDFAQTSSDTRLGDSCAPCVQEATHLEAARMAETLRAGGEVTCVLEDERAACLGRNSFGQLGRGLADENPHATLGELGLVGVTDVGVGRHHVCAVSRGELWCAGLGHLGQLGFPPDESCAVPPDVASEEGVAATVPCATEFTRVPELNDVARVVIRRHTTCAVSTQGTVTCFGDPAPLPGTHVAPLPLTEIDALEGRVFALGWDHGCRLADSGRPECWGDHRRGQLGVGAVPSQCGPVRCDEPVPLVDEGRASEVAAGDGFTCLAVEGAIRCFGSAASGQLGISSPDDLDLCDSEPCSTTPRDVRFEGISDLPESIVSGDHHACALMSNGTASCWGKNDRAQIARHRSDVDDAVLMPSVLYGL